MVGTLIIYAHPGGKGHNALILEGVERSLQEMKRSYAIIDLYKDGYDPVLHEQERLLDEATKKYQAMIKGARSLIFIYPVWWGGPPAILKGFFDRVFAARFAFRYVLLPFPVFGVRARPVGLLKGKRAVVFMTTGSLRWTQRLLFRDAYVFSAKRLILGFCGIRTRTYVLGDCGSPLDARKEVRIGRVVVRGLRWLSLSREEKD